MEIFKLMIEIIKKIGEIDGVVVAVITGVFTFLITKYTYYKNIPLDKLEISYNRVYYPIYRQIKSNDRIENIAEQCEIYLNKYEKYVDVSTLRAFSYLKDCLNSKSKEEAYSNFKSNIYKFDTKLRRRLGYLESNVFTMYTYSSPSDKRMIRLVFEFVFSYLPVFVMSYLSNGKLINSFVEISVLFICIFILEMTIVVIMVIKNWAIKVFIALKNVMFKFGSIIKKKSLF